MQPPEALFRGSVLALVNWQNQLRIEAIDSGNLEGYLPVRSPWLYPAAAHANGRFVVAGYTEDDGWQVKSRKSEPPPQPEWEDVPLGVSGAVCSVAISDGGTVAVGGFSADVGIQIYWRGGSPQRLDDPKQEEQFFYHEVAISTDEKHLYAVSRHIPPPQSSEREYALLRAWSISEETPLREFGQLLEEERVSGPVQAAAFLSSEHLLLLSVSQTLQLWQVP
jgi:hypothetical protein